MGLPEFRADGWLPDGHHAAAWDEIETRLGGETASPRARIMERLLTWRDALKVRQITGQLILNGSFVSAKPAPGDVDCIFVNDDIVGERLKTDAEARRLMDYEACRQSGLGDIFVFPANVVRDFPAFCRLDAFDFDKSGIPKGVVETRI